jgi:hypothetical protein
VFAPKEHDVETLGERAFGLFDQDSVVEGELELFGQLMTRSWSRAIVATSANA